MTARIGRTGPCNGIPAPAIDSHRQPPQAPYKGSWHWGVSPLVDNLDIVKPLEDAGSSATGLRSRFEERITVTGSGHIHEMAPLDRQFAGAPSGFPPTDHAGTDLD